MSRLNTSHRMSQRRRFALIVQRGGSRSGFTLVEMLVSTALVVLIMTLFAQIYGSTVQTITQQRGIGNNDQKARTLNMLMLNDLNARTYRQGNATYTDAKGIIPINAGDADDLAFDQERQRGYFYISENDPDDDTDDVLQFTAQIGTAATAGDQATDSSKLFLGKALSLSDPPGNMGFYFQSQPDADDGVRGNNIGQSRAAEICYFVRGGNLYRRVLLLRDPQYASPAIDPQLTDPTNATYIVPGTRNNLPPLILGSGPPSSYFNVFDYSTTRRSYDVPTNYFWLNNVNSLSNLFDNETSLGITRFRYGFETFATPPSATVESPLIGLPVEYTTADRQFFGRLTHQETSSPTCTWPASSQALGPFPNLTADYEVANLADGQRVGEDILMTNVEGMDVKVFDPGTNGFVDLSRGDTFNSGVSLLGNPGFHSDPHTPGTPLRNNFTIFDTWHERNVFGGVTLPPVYPLKSHNATVLTPNTSGGGTWCNEAPILGQIYRRPAVTGVNAMSPKVYQVVEQRNTMTYGGLPGNGEPSQWDLPYNESFEDGDLTWKVIDNRIGLRAIQITIRYRDPAKGLSKQLTLIHSFVE
ncbi:PulJ/GspJ family protein [Planctomicrobium sp. SH668]|uniref:PulJ/GspJ family protein n=1 Tax=Planctomicrobium sp. SH668 TaxID=3448126 RepID=UPI003F5BD1ED